MGQRANYVIIEHGKYKLYYSHWAGNTVTRDLFWGPEFAYEFIRHQQELDPNDWLDDVWCEGGAVVDLDRRRFTLFGGQDVNYEIQLRRLYLRLLAVPWSDWVIKWTLEGIAGLADAAGYPREKVLSKPQKRSDQPFDFAPPTSDPDRMRMIVAVSDQQGSIAIYPFEAYFSDMLLRGEQFLDAVLKESPLSELSVTEDGRLKGGVHFDMRTRKMSFWCADTMADFDKSVANAWPRWNTQWRGDEFEFQKQMTLGKLKYLRVAENDLLPRLEQMLLDIPTHGAVERFLSIIETLHKSGATLGDINPMAMVHTDWLLPISDRKRILDAVKSSVFGHR